MDAPRALPPKAPVLAWAAVAMSIGCAVGLGALRAANGEGEPLLDPWAAPSLALVFAAPGFVGWLGAARHSRHLLGVAGLGCLGLSVLAFSGVTLVLLVPGIAFLGSAAVGRRDDTSWSLRRTGAIVGWTVVVVASLFVAGPFGAIALAAAPFIVVGLRRADSRRWRGMAAGRAVAAATAVVLLWTAPLVLFSQTQTVCWQTRSTPGGQVTERIPGTTDEGVVLGANGVVASGCDSGVTTPAGVGLALAADGAALLVALLVALLPGRRGSAQASRT